MLPTDEPQPDEAPKPEPPPPSNMHVMDMAIQASRMHEEQQRRAAFNAAITAMNLRGFPGWIPLAPGPLPDDHPFYALIGRVAAEWAQIEHLLDLIVWELSGSSHELLSCITGQLVGQWGRFNAVQALAAAKGFDAIMLKRIDTLSGKTATLAKRRNRFVHVAWYIKQTEGGSKIGQFKSYSAKDNQFGFDEVNSDYAKETVDLIKTKFSEIGELRSDLLKGPLSS